MKYEVYENKTKLWSLFIVLVLVELGFTLPILMYISDSNAMSFLTFLLFATLFLIIGWAAFKFIGKLKNNNPLLIFDEQHLTLYQNPKQPIKFNWEDIEGLFPYVVSKQKFLGIILNNEEKYVESLPNNLKRWANINLKTGYPAFNISLQFIKKSNELLEKFDAIGIPFLLPEK